MDVENHGRSVPLNSWAICKVELPATPSKENHGYVLLRAEIIVNFQNAVLKIGEAYYSSSLFLDPRHLRLERFNIDSRTARRRLQIFLSVCYCSESVTLPRDYVTRRY